MRLDKNCIPESDKGVRAYRRNWARLIQKIYEADSLTCPKCRGTVRIVSFIEAREVIKTILKHLRLWLAKPRADAKAHALPAGYIMDHFFNFS